MQKIIIERKWNEAPGQLPVMFEISRRPDPELVNIYVERKEIYGLMPLMSHLLNRDEKEIRSVFAEIKARKIGVERLKTNLISSVTYIKKHVFECMVCNELDNSALMDSHISRAPISREIKRYVCEIVGALFGNACFLDKNNGFVKFIGSGRGYAYWQNYYKKQIRRCRTYGEMEEMFTSRTLHNRLMDEFISYWVQWLNKCNADIPYEKHIRGLMT